MQAQRAEQAQQQAETQRRHGGQVPGGTGRVSSGQRERNGLTNQVDAGGHMTLREAIEAAFEQAERG